MAHLIFRSLGLGFLAGIAGGAFAAVAASMLGLSPRIAGGVAGLALALTVVTLDYRHRLQPPR